MANLPRVLGLVLTVGMVALGPQRSVRTESPDTAWWGARDSIQFQKAAREQISAGNFAAAEAIFKQAAAQAIQHGDRVAAVRYLSGAASTHMARFDYRAALNGYLAARDLAVEIHDRLDLGGLAVNLSSLYMQMWDFDSALQSAEEARAVVEGIPKVYYRPQLLLQLGRLHAELQDGRAETFYLAGIESARAEAANSEGIAVEAKGWDLLGELRLSRGDLGGAEHAYLESFLLRRLFVPRDVGVSYSRLSALYLAQAEDQRQVAERVGLLAQAGRFTERAFEEHARGSVTLPLFWLYYQRGRIRLAQGQQGQAVADLATAADLAGRWRAGIVPALSSLDSATANLGEQIYSAFAHTAASYGLKTGNARWLEQSFQAVEVNRASSLMDSEGLARVWREKLPPEFWNILSQLRARSVPGALAGSRSGGSIPDLNLKLTEMEAQAGLGFSLNNPENFRRRGSLIHFQQGLRAAELVLSFDLGEEVSYLWSVTRNSVRAYRLASRARIRTAVQGFRNSIEKGRPDTEHRASELYNLLFGQLRPGERRKPEWVLSLEDVLFELPFAALVTERSDSAKRSRMAMPIRAQHGGQSASQGPGMSRPPYLAELHSLQVVPAALLRGAKPFFTEGKLVAVGDPIYNLADERWTPESPRRWWNAAAPNGSGELMQFNRLPGSGREVESSCRAWGANHILLESVAARKQQFLSALSPAPSVIHLATHVVTAPGPRNQSFLAFGMGPEGRAELLSTSDIAVLQVPGSLVVMTGCSTAPADLRSGSGLVGLTRAWMMSGASGVIVTHWPVKDFTGELLARFYIHLKKASPAEALRRSQVEMIHSGTGLAAPAAWASYQVFGGAL